eukprot:CAMPEP_0202888684 /NCGR_PEP_ID=MMETSP1391-20130828/43318_1 /ASSEMBLY_ACC=CAM_ASM_000867 /TAXON_ID=1034604 /ORGANISM="Chlamydomonas leiostraca, Strain SAG 11-49" /LENGTH=91 /DNA_ID=CAMNT_0049571995 /DNA_START=518 /DNA_END=793 /DNA_ORIENTATION=+
MAGVSGATGALRQVGVPGALRLRRAALRRSAGQLLPKVIKRSSTAAAEWCCTSPDSLAESVSTSSSTMSGMQLLTSNVRGLAAGGASSVPL